VTFGETRVEWLLSDLAESPATAAIDATGNAIHAVAQRLDSLAPFTRDHHGTRFRRVSLHNHSRFSGNPALNRTLFEGMSVFVREAWWTDHNIGTVRTIVGGDFEDPQLVKRFWWAKQQRAELLHAGRVAEGAAGRAWTGINRAGVPCEPYAPLGARTELRFSWKPTGSTIAFAEVQLASTNLLRYLSARPDDFDPKRDIVLESPADTWTDHVVDLAAGHAALFDGRFSDCFVDVTLGVLCQPGESAEALFDELELITSEPSDLIRVQLNELARSRLVSSYVGMEQSAWYGDTGMGPCFPHLTFLAPGDVSKLFPNVEREPLPADRRAMVEQVQAAGGCVGTHHMQFNEHYFALLEGGGLGIDLFEIGGVWGRPPYYGTLEERRDRDAHRYPDRLVDEVHPLLVRWDRLTARGILLTGYGAPDLNGLFNRPMQHSFNRWLTSILSEDDSSESLLRALRSGRAVASEWRTPALVTLSAGDGLVMGKLVVTDAKRHTLRARVSAAAPGSRLSFVVGPLVRDRWDADLDAGIAPVEASDPFVLGAVDSEIEYEIDTARGCFVRAELRNPAGHLIALGNPVYFLPYWPERWPFGRVAFDWQGVRLGGEDGLLLEDARVDRDGRLVLSGSVFADSGELRVVCPSSPLSVEPSAGSWSWDQQGRLLVLTDLPSGDFTLAATFAEPLATGRTADFTAVPERKQVLARIDVGDPESEAGRLLSGFGDIVVVPALRAYRGVQQSGGEFELPVPVDRSTWLKIQQAPATFSMTGEHPFVACRVLMDGTEIGRIGVFDSPVIEIPPTPSPTGTSVVVRRFSIQMLTNERLAIDVIWLYGGPGVVEY